MGDKVNSPLSWLLVLWIGAAAGCSEQAGWGVQCGSHVAMTSKEAAQFRKSLNAWLDSMGFVPTTSPGGVDSGAGIHQRHEVPSWYQGTYHGSPTLWLEVRTVPRPDTHTEMTEYQFSHLWRVQGTAGEVAHWRELSADFTRTLRAWLDGIKAPKERTNGA